MTERIHNNKGSAVGAAFIMSSTSPPSEGSEGGILFLLQQVANLAKQFLLC